MKLARSWSPVLLGGALALACGGRAPIGMSQTGAAGTAAAGTTGAAAGTAAAGTTGAAGTGTAGTAAAGTGAAGTVARSDIAKVAPTAGCGKPAEQALGTLVRGTIMVMGTKDANCADQLAGDGRCGPWALQREYYLGLPASYDGKTAYPLVFEGPGCGGKGNDLYINPTLSGMVIRVGLTPPPNSVGHGTNPDQGCFDDKEGDDSVEWAFYENLYDELAGEICFDRNRVFAAGNSSGAWLANELGCKYAGDAVHPIRGVMPNRGGMPTDPRFVPTCTTKPMAGIWVHDVGNTTAPFTGSIVAMNRALKVNNCTPDGVSYQTAMFDPFPLGADATSCKRYRGCPDLYPLVVCPLLGGGIGSNNNVVNPAWVAFIKLFPAAPLP